MPEFSCAEYSFPLLYRLQTLRLLQILEFEWVDIGLFERNPSFLPSELMEAPSKFIHAIREDLESSQIRAADVFLQIGRDPAESSANDPDPAVRARNREVFLRALEFCVALECAHLTGLPGVPHGESQRDFALAAEEATWRLARCREAGVVYAVEAHIGSICADTALARQMLSAVPGLTLTLDYGHFICQGEENAAVHALLPFASHLHARGGARGRLQTSVAENAIDFAGMVAGLRAYDCNRTIALEYVWVDWEGCNRTDNISETILLRERLMAIAAALDSSF
jgi:sugar phosphate isomerase/epimerase